MDPAFPFLLPADLQLEVFAYAAARDEVAVCFRAACEQGSARLARRLAALFSLTPANTRAGILLDEVCWRGHLEVARWLVGHFGLTPANVRAGDCRPFRAACAAGRLEVGRWLAEHFGLTRSDARARGSFALRGAAWGAHLATVCWLVVRSPSSVTAARCEFVEETWWASARGSLCPVRWLVGRCGVRVFRQHFRDGALAGACCLGFQRAAGWLAARGRLFLADQHAQTLASARGHWGIVCKLAARSADAAAARTSLNIACSRGYFALARWLAERYGPPMNEAREDCLARLEDSWRGGHAAIVRWQARQLVLQARHLQAGALARLNRAGGSAPLDLMCWIAAEWGVSAERMAGVRDEGAKPKDVVCSALQRRRWGLARWFAARFGRALVGGGAELRSACHSGCAAVARRALDRATVRDARTHRGLLRAACGRAHLGVAHLLSSRLPQATKRFDIRGALRNVGENGELGIARWLAGRLALSSAEAQSAFRQAINRAYRLRRFEVVCWLLASPILPAPDARSLGLDILSRAAAQGHVELAGWLAEWLAPAGVPIDGRSSAREGPAAWPAPAETPISPDSPSPAPPEGEPLDGSAESLINLLTVRRAVVQGPGWRLSAVDYQVSASAPPLIRRPRPLQGFPRSAALRGRP
ncbi:MAG TPA: hypothetical protein VNI01_12435 [Elusimicrobiota bacterium]|jgi:hypothetical protein|nr:hypothetical protein [Elusimicrobiota bacterium]